MSTVSDLLDRYTQPGRLYERLENGALRCTACGHRCVIQPGKRGACQVRFNQDGELRVPWGYVAAAHVDPVEKKPFFHLLPGSPAFTFGMLGCDFHCSFCQNWVTSQVMHDEEAAYGARYLQPTSASALVEYARRSGAPLLVSSYNEPLITTEWAEEIFRLGNVEGMQCAFVSNGNATPEVLEDLRPYLTAYKIDLKSMQQKNYRALGGSVKNVLDTIRRAKELGLWVEVVTLVIPGYNDSNEELMEMGEFLVSVSPDIPWHLTAFHPDYHMTGPSATPADSLQRGAEIGQEAGLHFVYAGNLPGRVGSLEDTFCPSCCTCLIKRRGFAIHEYHITAEGKCPQCGTTIPGIWTRQPDSIRTGQGWW